MHIDELYPSKYLKASDIPDGGVIYTIASVKVEELGRDKERKPVVRFHRVEKAMVLNKTNANTLSLIYGRDTDSWIGNDIGLYSTEVEMGGEQREAIRLRRPEAMKKRPDHQAPAQARPKRSVQTDDFDHGPERYDYDPADQAV